MKLKNLGLLLLQTTLVVSRCRPRSTRTSASLTSTTIASDAPVSSSSVSSRLDLSSSTGPALPSTETSETTSTELLPSVSSSADLFSTTEEAATVSSATVSTSTLEASSPSESSASAEPSSSVPSSADQSSTTGSPLSSTTESSSTHSDPPSSVKPTSTTTTADSTPSSSGEPPLLFTGVTATATTSASSCYDTPTPTYSLQKVGLGGLSSELESYSMFVDHSGQPVYLELTSDGVQYLVDIQDPERLVIVDPRRNTLMLDEAGLRFADRGCETDVHISVPGMWGQLVDLDQDQEDSEDSSPARRRRDLGTLVRRAPQQNFTVRAKVTDQCFNGIPDARLSLGPSPCARTAEMDEYGQHLWSCNWPGANHPISRCIDSVNLFGDRLSVALSSLSLLAKGGLTAVAVRRMVAQALLAATISTGGLLTPVVLGFIAVIAVLETANELMDVINAGDPNRLATFLCDVAKPYLGGFPMHLGLTADRAPDAMFFVAFKLTEYPGSSITPQAFFFNLPDHKCDCVRHDPCLAPAFFPECPGGQCMCIEDASSSDDGETGRRCYAKGGYSTLTWCETAADCYPGQFCLTQYLYFNRFYRKACGAPISNICQTCRTVPF